MKRLRLKTYLVVLPIIAATVLVGSFFAYQESRSGLTRLASRHMTYKAEQLRDFINSEWSVVESLGLDDDQDFRAAQEASFRSYAYSLLRSDSEAVATYDDEGRLLFAVSAAASGDEEAFPPPGTTAGWFSSPSSAGERVGIAFAFEPFGWTVALSESADYFYSDERDLLRGFAWILAVAFFAAVILITVYLRRVTGPLERLSDAVAAIAETGDLARRVPEEYDDEIGDLAARFNDTLAALEDGTARLAETAEAERLARATTEEREHETLWLLARIADYNDEQTGAHVQRIGELSAFMLRLLGRGDEEATLMRAAAPLHDIGKIAVSESLLNKPGRLTPDEFETMKTHTTIGHDLLGASRSRFLAEGAEIALTHHERWDGSGYPRGLAGEDIPLSGRVVAIMDVYDALVSGRPYKGAWPEEAARDHIAGQRGAHFDPRLVDLFIERFDEFAAIRAALVNGPVARDATARGAAAGSADQK